MPDGQADGDLGAHRVTDDGWLVDSGVLDHLRDDVRLLVDVASARWSPRLPEAGEVRGEHSVSPSEHTSCGQQVPARDDAVDQNDSPLPGSGPLQCRTDTRWPLTRAGSRAGSGSS